jgi:predicted permease
MVAVISYENWQHNYAADPSVIGSTFWVNTKPVVIAGVAPQGFYGDRLASSPPDYYLPIETMGVLLNVSYLHDPTTQWAYIVGRVKPGTALGPLQTKISGLLRQILATDPIYSSDQGKKALARAHIVLSPAGGGIQNLQEQYKSNLHMLMWVSGLVLLIACANIANLLLVRGMGRKAEMSLRTALGAARSRIIRQLLTESIVLSVISGIAGLIVAYAGTHALLAMAFPGEKNVPIDASPSLPVLAFACALCLVTGILFGVAPAWIAAQTQPIDALRTGSRSTSTRASLLQRSLVVLQAALSLVLLIGAGLFAQSLNKLQTSDLKLEAANRYIVHINPQAAGYLPSQLAPVYQAFEDRFHAGMRQQRPGQYLCGCQRDDEDAVPERRQSAGHHRVHNAELPVVAEQQQRCREMWRADDAINAEQRRISRRSTGRNVRPNDQGETIKFIPQQRARCNGPGGSAGCGS